MTDAAAYKVDPWNDLRAVEGLTEIVSASFARKLELALTLAEAALVASEGFILPSLHANNAGAYEAINLRNAALTAIEQLERARG